MSKLPLIQTSLRARILEYQLKRWKIIDWLHNSTWLIQVLEDLNGLDTETRKKEGMTLIVVEEKQAPSTNCGGSLASSSVS